MSRIIKLQVEIDKSEIYIANECSSGAKYYFENSNDIGKAMKQYVETYCNIRQKSKKNWSDKDVNK